MRQGLVLLLAHLPPSSAAGPARRLGANAGSTVAFVVGGLAAVGALVLYCLWYRRQHGSGFNASKQNSLLGGQQRYQPPFSEDEQQQQQQYQDYQQQQQMSMVQHQQQQQQQQRRPQGTSMRAPEQQSRPQGTSVRGPTQPRPQGTSVRGPAQARPQGTSVRGPAAAQQAPPLPPPRNSAPSTPTAASGSGSGRRGVGGGSSPRVSSPRAGAAVVSYTSAAMEAATDDFSDANKLDEGAFGAVFRGVLGGRAVAIKVLKLASCAPKGQTALQPFVGKHSFRREADVLGQHHHINLVRLIGHCFADQVHADGVRHCLVFEFCAGGSLESRLEQQQEGATVGGGDIEELVTSNCSKYTVGQHVEGLKKGAVTGTVVRVAADNGSVPPAQSGPGVIAVRTGEARVLSCEQRLTIASDVARGLEYLHVDCDPPIIHQDIKSANILLSEAGDGRLVAKVADFGAARFVPQLLKQDGSRRSANTHHSTVHVVGTKPYQPLEYLQLGHVSEKTDSYAFGVVLLELLTGKPPFSGKTMLAAAFHATLFRGPDADIVAGLAGHLDAAPGPWPFERALGLARIAKRCLETIVAQRCAVCDVLVDIDVLAGRQAIVRAGRGQEYDPTTGKLVDIAKQKKKKSRFGRS